MVKGSGVSDEGMAYEGCISMDLKGMTKSEISSSLANILNSNLKKSRINLKKRKPFKRLLEKKMKI